MPRRPTYRELVGRAEQPPGSTWGLFPVDPERGMANLAGPEEVRSAAALIRTGTTHSLDYALDAFDPPLSPRRSLPQHVITAMHADQRDDRLDGFFLQGSSQIDGLRHRRHHAHGFYGGVPDEEVRVGSPAIGVNRWADAPIVGRGVLLDLDAHRRRRGAPIDHRAGEALDIDELDDVAAAHGTDLRVGDLLLIHTGWTAWYLGLPRTERVAALAAGRFTGFAQSEHLLEWLWDRGAALAASDTTGLEVQPPVTGSTYGGPTDPGLVHQDLIALLGLPLGELWKLDGLAAEAARSGRSEFFTVVKPLALVGGVGSPANATVVL